MWLVSADLYSYYNYTIAIHIHMTGFVCVCHWDKSVAKDLPLSYFTPPALSWYTRPFPRAHGLPLGGEIIV